ALAPPPPPSPPPRVTRTNSSAVAATTTTEPMITPLRLPPSLGPRLPNPLSKVSPPAPGPPGPPGGGNAPPACGVLPCPAIWVGGDASGMAGNNNPEVPVTITTLTGPAFVDGAPMASDKKRPSPTSSPASDAQPRLLSGG